MKGGELLRAAFLLLSCAGTIPVISHSTCHHTVMTCHFDFHLNKNIIVPIEPMWVLEIYDLF